MGFTVSYTALWVIVLFQFLVAAGLLREIRLIRGMPELSLLPVGTRAPAFTGTDLYTGRRISSKEFGGRAFVILLVTPACPACSRLLESLALRGGAGMLLLIVCSGDEARCMPLMPNRPNTRFFAQTDADLRQLFGISGSPAAIIVDSEGSIRGYGQPVDSEQLVRLFLESTGPRAHYDSAAVTTARGSVG